METQSKKFYGSIDFSKLLEAVHAKHSAFVRVGDKKHLYGNITLWINAEPDKYGNTMSIQLNPAKDSGDEKIYFANLKESQYKVEGVSDTDVQTMPTDDDLPF